MPSSPFIIREKVAPAIVSLLSETVLGTNGAQYRHLDTKSRIKEIDTPLFLSLERNDKVLGNVTFCRRDTGWYVRYFAFSKLFQSSGKKRSKSKSENGLKNELNAFFDMVLNENSTYGKTDRFYAYIDPNNEKSKWLSESFGFQTVGELITQTYSRVKPKASSRCYKSSNWTELKDIFNSQFRHYKHYFNDQLQKGPFYVVRDKHGETIACAKITRASWEIKRLPGKMGQILVRIIPYIPVLNKLIQPNRHLFIVPEAVYVKNNDPEIADELFQAILHGENSKLMIWWIDPKETLYKSIQTKLRWGILNRLIGINKVLVVERKRGTDQESEGVKAPFYVSGVDCV